MKVYSDDNLALPASNQKEHELRAELWEIALSEVDAMTDAECDGIASNRARRTQARALRNFLALEGEDPRFDLPRHWFLAAVTGRPPAISGTCEHQALNRE